MINIILIHMHMYLYHKCNDLNGYGYFMSEGLTSQLEESPNI